MTWWRCSFFDLFLVLLVLSIYGSHRYVMAYLYYKHKDNCRPPRQVRPLPRVTSSFPSSTRCRASSACSTRSRIDYPRDSSNPVLDDSTDETQGIAGPRSPAPGSRAWTIAYLHGNNRDGYKPAPSRKG